MADPMYTKAVEYYSKGDVNSAFSVLDQYLKKSPRDAQAHIFAGVILQNQGKLVEALPYFLRGVDINPDPAWHVTVGGVYSKLRGQGYINDEIAQYKQAIKRNPKMAGAWYALAGAYLFLGDYTQAEQAASKAVQFGPQDARNHHQLALSFFFRGQNAKAMALIDTSNEYAVKHLGPLLDAPDQHHQREWFAVPTQTTELFANQAGQTYGVPQPNMAVPPGNLSDQVPPMHYTQPGIHKVTLSNVYIEGLFGIVYDDTRVYTNQYTRLRGVWRFFHQAGPQHPRETVQCDRLVALNPPDLPNYYHWLIECLPQVILIKDMMDRDPGLLFLAPAKGWPSFMQQHLDLLGMDPERMIHNTAGPNRRYFARELTYVDWQWPLSTLPCPDQPASAWYPPRTLLLLLRKTLAKPFPDPDNRDRIVYVSRSTGLQRVVRNESLLIDMLKSRYKDKLDVFVGTGMDARQQIDIFRHARIVIGPHGAGLSNAVFCAAGTSLIEFPVIPAVLNFFAHIAAACGLDYWWIPEVRTRFEASYNIDQAALDTIERTLDACEIYKPELI